jgi:hypothetical protein
MPPTRALERSETRPLARQKSWRMARRRRRAFLPPLPASPALLGLSGTLLRGVSDAHTAIRLTQQIHFLKYRLLHYNGHERR